MPTKDEMLKALKYECFKRINRVYTGRGSTDFNKEVFDRLRSMEQDAPVEIKEKIAAANKERRRLLTIHGKLKSIIMEAATDESSAAIDIYSDTTWIN